MEAGKKVINLFRERGWTAIINDDLVDNALTLAALAVGAFCAAGGCLMVLMTSPRSEVAGSLYLIVGVIGLLIGWSMAGIVMSNIESSVATVFVCYAEDPAALQHNHPRDHYHLTEAWNIFFSSEMAECSSNEPAYKLPAGGLPVATAVPLPPTGLPQAQAMPLQPMGAVGSANTQAYPQAQGYATAQPVYGQPAQTYGGQPVQGAQAQGWAQPGQGAPMATATAVALPAQQGGMAVHQI